MRAISLAIVSLSLLGSLAADAPSTQPDPSLPRYIFTVGRQLTYTGDFLFKTDQGNMHTTVTTKITVAARNPDGSSRLIIQETEKEQDADSDPGQVTTQIGQADMTTDGRVVSTTGDTIGSLPETLPRLPANAKELAAGWAGNPQMPGESMAFSIPPPTAPNPPGTFTFASSAEGVFNKIYGLTRKETLHFNWAKGMIADLSGTIHQDYGFKGDGTISAKLTGDEILPAQQAATLAKDTQAYLDFQSKFSDLLDNVRAHPDHFQAITQDIDAALDKADAAVTTAAIKAELTDVRKEVADDVDEFRQTGQRIADIIGKPAPDFTAADLSGVPHKLSDYRGKIVVLDFWYRGCPWCIRSMPQTKQIVDHFAGKPVVILGLNTDSDPADAKFVIDTMKLNYPTLRIDADTLKRFDVHAFPSILLIDQTGTIKDFIEGYSPTLGADLEKKIHDLLNASDAEGKKSDGH